MKKVLIALVAIAALIAAVVVLVFHLTRGVTQAGDRFLALVRDGKTHEAYLLTAKAFRTATPEEGFVSFLKSSSLAENEQAEWSSRSLSGNTGELEGSIRTRRGGRQMPLEEMRSSFHAFVDKKIPLTVVETSAPVFTGAASIDSDGVLNVSGHYPTRPFRVNFELRFLNEESRWRLAGINVTTKEE